MTREMEKLVFILSFSVYVFFKEPVIFTEGSALLATPCDLINTMSKGKRTRAQSSPPSPVVGGFIKHCSEFMQCQYAEEPREKKAFIRNDLWTRISGSYLFRNSTNK